LRRTPIEKSSAKFEVKQVKFSRNNS